MKYFANNIIKLRAIFFSFKVCVPKSMSDMSKLICLLANCVIYHVLNTFQKCFTIWHSQKR